MFGKRPPGRPRSPAAQHLTNLVALKSDECQFFPFEQEKVAFSSGARSPQWITCRLANGMPGAGQVPVRQCGVSGCINGYHYKWGTMAEAQDARVYKPRSGGNNPNAKLDETKVAAIKATKWLSGNQKVQAAKSYGISVKTLNSIIKGWSWAWVKPANGDTAPKTKDEF